MRLIFEDLDNTVESRAIDAVKKALSSLEKYATVEIKENLPGSISIYIRPGRSIDYKNVVEACRKELFKAGIKLNRDQLIRSEDEMQIILSLTDIKESQDKYGQLDMTWEFGKAFKKYLNYLVTTQDMAENEAVDKIKSSLDYLAKYM